MVVYYILTIINRIIDYLRDNAWPICVLVGIGYLLKDQVIKYRASRSGIPLNSSQQPVVVGGQQQQHNNSRTTSTTTNRDDEIRLVRLRQQEIANERAIQALEERKKKECDEKERKNMIAKKKVSTTTGNENKLGKGPASSSESFNPLQPWSSNRGKGGYKPPRRNVGRGG